MLYFNNYFRLYEETEITIGQLRKKLYEDTAFQKRLGITENIVDTFWEAFIDGAFDPKGKNIRTEMSVMQRNFK